MEVLKKCSPKAIPALLNVRKPTPKLTRQITQLVKIPESATVYAGDVGAGIGAIIGGGLGVLAGRVWGWLQVLLWVQILELILVVWVVGGLQLW